MFVGLELSLRAAGMLGGAPSAPALTNDNPSHVTISGGQVTAGNTFPAGWGNAAHTTAGLLGNTNFVLEVVSGVTNDSTVGLNTTPLTAASYNSIANGFVAGGSSWTIVAASSPVAGPAKNVGDVLRLEHTAGGNLVWKINGSTVHTMASPFTGSDTVFADFDAFGNSNTNAYTFVSFG